MANQQEVVVQTRDGQGGRISGKEPETPPQEEPGFDQNAPSLRPNIAFIAVLDELAKVKAHGRFGF